MKLGRLQTLGLAAIMLAAVGYLGQASLTSVVKIKSSSLPIGIASNPSLITLKPHQTKATITSPTFASNFEFNAIAPHWYRTDKEQGHGQVALRTSDDGQHWTGWTDITVMSPQKDGAPHADELFPEAPLFATGHYFQYRVQLARASAADTAPVVKNLTVSYFDSRPTKLQQLGDHLRHLFSQPVSASSAIPNVVSRAAWGNPDPAGQAFKGTDLYWQPSYSPVQQIFVHHTVDSNTQSDWPSVVRAIWQYHTYTLGWGDIGYNYLVDGNGTIYQGRAGGDNVVGGHVYGYNWGSMGVALIGCFQPGSTCSQLNNGITNGPSSAMLNGLTDLLAWKSTSYGIDPTAQHNFCQGDGTNCLNLYTIAGHRDAYNTSCPGDLAYNDLASIRSQTAAKKTAYSPSSYDYSAQQETYQTVDLGDNNSLSVTLSFKNTGAATWTSAGGANPIQLQTANPDGHASAFQGSDWLSSSVVANLNETSVAPGQTGSFTFDIKNPSGYLGTWFEYFQLVPVNGGSFNAFFGQPIETRDCTYSIAGQAAYTDSTKAAGLDLTNLSPGQTGWLTLQVKNTGNVTWTNSGNNPVDLGTSSPTDRASRFATPAWMGANRPARLAEASVAPGSTGTFEWPFQVPAGGGDFREFVTPVVEGLTWMNDTGVNYYLHVNSGYSWQPAGQYAYTDASKSTPVDMARLSPGQRIYVGVLAKNTGNTTWYNTGNYAVHLGTDEGRDHASAFCDRSSWLGCNRPAGFKNAADPAATGVTPGQTAEFGFWYDIPALNGTYRDHFTPVAEGITWLPDLGLNFYTAVNGSYSWGLAGQAAYSDAALTTPANLTALHPGDITYWEVWAKNTGTATWYNTGSYPIDLGTSHPNDRLSNFCDSGSWLGCNRPVRLQETSVTPGQTGTFTFKTVAPPTGTYLEYLNLVAEGITWLNDPGMNFYTEVK